MADHERERRVALLRACDQILSGVRPLSMAERLAALPPPPPEAMPDYYGDGGPVGELEERVAGLLGTEAAAFFVTGTMAQQVALRIGAEWTGNPAVGLHPLSHLVRHERDADMVLSGLRRVHTTDAPRNPVAGEVAGLDEPIGTLVLVLELPLRDAGFVLPTWDELTGVVAAARAAGARVHLDGARLWESAYRLGRPLAEVAGLADTVYVSFYKSLGGISGAALAGPADVVAQARAWRHRYGGQVFQYWPAALSALAGLDEELPRLGRYLDHARTVAAALAAVPGARTFPAPPHTHQFRLWLPYPPERLRAANLALAERERRWFASNWEASDVPGLSVTEITVAAPALRLDAAAVTELTERFLAYAARGETPS
ncbi:beta-eliminating lyase-related protein [Micromonospora sp. NPDC049559]|uniref:threonine aldolase family protein n=1 Tax=Micromonospora sp. NPDC049559 TaxID=3155923 RepID=UPI00343E0D26